MLTHQRMLIILSMRVRSSLDALYTSHKEAKTEMQNSAITGSTDASNENSPDYWFKCGSQDGQWLSVPPEISIP